MNQTPTIRQKIWANNSIRAVAAALCTVLFVVAGLAAIVALTTLQCSVAHDGLCGLGTVVFGVPLLVISALLLALLLFRVFHVEHYGLMFVVLTIVIIGFFLFQ